MKFISLITTIMSATMAGLATAQITGQDILGHSCAGLSGEYSFSVAYFGCAAMRLRTYGCLQAIWSAERSQITTTAIPFFFFVDRRAQSSAFNHVAVPHAVRLLLTLAFALTRLSLGEPLVASHVRVLMCLLSPESGFSVS